MLLITSIAKDTLAATVKGKITQKGVQEGTSKAGKKYARLTLAVSTTDYNLKSLKTLLGKELTRNGENPKYPLLFVDIVGFDKTADFMVKNYNAGETIVVLGVPSVSEYKEKYSLSVTLGAATKDFTNGNTPTTKAATETSTEAKATVEDDLPEVDW